MPRLKSAFWIIFAVTMGIYATMLAWSLPRISTAANGLAPFDMRPTGYSFDEAQTFLAALPPETTAFYRDIQLAMLDLVYPALLGVTLFLAIGLLLPQSWKAARWILPLIAIPGSVFDYLENRMITTMLNLGPNGISPEIVATASDYTLRKAQFTTIGMSVLIFLLAIWLWRKISARSRKGSSGSMF